MNCEHVDICKGCERCVLCNEFKPCMTGVEPDQELHEPPTPKIIKVKVVALKGSDWMDAQKQKYNIVETPIKNSVIIKLSNK